MRFLTSSASSSIELHPVGYYYDLPNPLRSTATSL